jgi:hypothetical protein
MGLKKFSRTEAYKAFQMEDKVKTLLFDFAGEFPSNGS